ncbi:wax ester/triacylglycerol synthase family O-acyltransferase [Rhodococcus aetherivorans]|uniref:wax ester/triacylglycerol synthase family O-acyltransferase n=1 Tax=Rhodococcus aetherivorans TaxID=191292 RepID=UPI0036C0A93A
MQVMSLPEALFVLLETSSRPLHLGALALFEPPPDAGDDHARRMYETLLAHDEVADPLRRRPVRTLRGAGYPWWSRPEDVDLRFHVRHTAVPGSGSMADLLALVSRIHGSPLDPLHPMWEVYVIEGLEDGRTAMYAKIHLSLADGPAGLRLLHRSMSTDPDARDCPAPWSPEVVAPRARLSPLPTSWLRAGLRVGSEVFAMTPEIGRLVTEGVRRHQVALPWQTPPTMFNVAVGRGRTLAARSWPIERLHSVATSAGTTIDAVVLTMCAGGLRAYLSERYALPEAPLTAMLPVPMNLGGAAVGPGGREPGVGAMVIGLATDEPDPAVRLARITDSLVHTDRVVTALSGTQFLMLSALSLSPLALEPVRRFVDEIPPPFNVLISYLPGPSRTRYWNGARLTGIYPVPAVLNGQALSITLTGNDGRLDLGVVGDRHAVPALDRLVELLEGALTELESAVGTRPR